MICENCHENEATVHYTEIINGVKTEHHLCSECAGKINLSGYMGSLGGEFPFVKLLTGLLSSGREKLEDNPMYKVTCPKCHMTYEEFANVGKFGCAECYDVFGPLIEDNLKKLQGGTQHHGKNPRSEIEESNEEKTVDVESKIDILKNNLKNAVEVENFDLAAKLRDEIKELREKENKNA